MAQEAKLTNRGDPAGPGSTIGSNLGSIPGSIPPEPAGSIDQQDELGEEDRLPMFLCDKDDFEDELYEDDDETGSASESQSVGDRVAALLKPTLLLALGAGLIVVIPSDRFSLAPLSAARAWLTNIFIPTSMPDAPTTGIASIRPEAPERPTRAEIAAAFRQALRKQSEAEVPPITPPALPDPPPPPAPPEPLIAAQKAPPPPPPINPVELATIMKRARSLLATGDIAPARLLLERAAGAGDAGAALLLARTYDPAVRGTADVRNLAPDPLAAANWYRKAAELGSPEAQQRLARE
jgi:hypothetical protein